MAGLPDDLRSMAYGGSLKFDPAVLHRAADELDARAARILRLEYEIRLAQQRLATALVPSVEEGQPLPGMTLTEDPTRMPIIFDAGVLPGEIEVRFGGKLVCKITGVGK